VKFIRKAREPRLLRQWRLENQQIPENLSYQNIPSKAKAELRASLLEEQGHLCAYTMMRISRSESGHIEHIFAQSSRPDLEVAYSNMVYCHPGDGAPRCPYGAHCKDGRDVSRDPFVSPLDESCEFRFAFDMTGAVKARDASDLSATGTIEILRLDDQQLKRARSAAIRQYPIFKRLGTPLTAAEARRFASRVMGRDAEGRFPAFAVAVHQVVLKYAERRAAKEAARPIRGSR
jgi:uncharacterized protein (TIGR02646 family)